MFSYLQRLIEFLNEWNTISNIEENEKHEERAIIMLTSASQS